MNFRDIRKFTRHANYRVHVAWTFLEKQLEYWNDAYLLEIEPEFQRAHVWDDDKRSKYIEYILQGGMSGKDIYFNCPEFGGGKAESRKFMRTLYIVDGLQRITAVRKFLNNKIKLFGLY